MVVGGVRIPSHTLSSPRMSEKTPAMTWLPCKMRRVSCLTFQVNPHPFLPPLTLPTQSLGSQKTES